ncbi:MAG: DUF4244 domain-containing protein [Microthrixaceae bacterium]
MTSRDHTTGPQDPAHPPATASAGRSDRVGADAPGQHPGAPQRAVAESAQSTVEYALVLLGAAALALLLVSWVTGTDVVGRLFDAVFSRILGQAG